MELKRLLSGFGLDEMSRGCAAPRSAALGPAALWPAAEPRELDRSQGRPEHPGRRRGPPAAQPATARTGWARSPHPITRAARNSLLVGRLRQPRPHRPASCVPARRITPRRPGSISSSWSQLSKYLYLPEEDAAEERFNNHLQDLLPKAAGEQTNTTSLCFQLLFKTLRTNSAV